MRGSSNKQTAADFQVLSGRTATKASLKSPGSMLQGSAGLTLKMPASSKVGLYIVDASEGVTTDQIPDGGKRIFDAL